MPDVNRPCMLDTNTFNDLLDGKVLVEIFARRHLLVTGIQADELRATSNPARRKSLLTIFEEVAPATELASSFAFGIEGAGFGQACWNDGSGIFGRMLTRLQELDLKKKKKVRDLRNQIRDVIILETSIKHNAILISNDCNLQKVASEFGCCSVNTFALKHSS